MMSRKLSKVGCQILQQTVERQARILLNLKENKLKQTKVITTLSNLAKYKGSKRTILKAVKCPRKAYLHLLTHKSIQKVTKKQIIEMRTPKG